MFHEHCVVCSYTCKYAIWTLTDHRCVSVNEWCYIYVFGYIES